MSFTKIVKNRAYFKRFQVKFRRRREGKTDYQARKRLVAQDKTKYNAPKYRFVVRFTLKDVICQVIAPKVKGDEVICVAYSHELPRYGLKVGLTNYSAAYCTGLLCARRLLHKFQLDRKYQGTKSVDGKFFLEENPEVGARPFKANLDVGLVRTTTGARVFGALKGACDGGLVVPHSEEGRRFPGWNSKTQQYDPKVHKDKIFGKHVSDYMKYLKKNDEKQYEKHFSQFLKNGVTADTDLAKMYASVHKAIRDDPSHKKKEKKVATATATATGTAATTATVTATGASGTVKPKSYRKVRLTLQERKERVKSKREKVLKEVKKLQEKAGVLEAVLEETGVVAKKKDRVKQLATKKPKAPKSAAKDDKKAGKAGAATGGKATAAAGGKAAAGATTAAAAATTGKAPAAGKKK